MQLSKGSGACKCSISISRKSDKEMRIPTLELKFMGLQRNLGKGKIENVNVDKTKQINKRPEKID